jgi:acylphosphatase
VGTSMESGGAFRVEGRVQGVGFRAWTVRMATQLGLRGWVRNLPDGSVEAHLAGPSDALRAAEARLAEGPPASRVDRLVGLGQPRGLPGEGVEIRW